MSVLPYRVAGMTAEISWLTNVLKAYNSERRQRLLDAPRLALNLSYELTGQQVRQAQAIIEIGDGAYTFPDWRFEQPISAGFSAASLAVTIDAAYFTPSVGDSVIVWQDSENFTEATVISLVSNTLTLSNGPVVAYGRASVLPALPCIVSNGLSVKIGTGGLAYASIGVVATNYSDISSWFVGATFDGKFVAPRDILRNAHEGSFFLAQSNVDFGLGPIQPVRIRATNDYGYSIQVSPVDKVGLIQAEAIFHTLAGRLNAFWRPTWLEDFKLVADAPASQSYIRVEVVAAGTDIPAIAIERKDGTKEYFQVISWSSTVDYTQINLDDFIAADINAVDVLTISTMRLSRLDTDSISFAFDGVGDANAIALTVEVAA